MRVLSALAFTLFSTAVIASPMRWDLDNVTFDDGTTATGYIVVDPATEEVLEVDILTEDGTDVRRGNHYLNTTSYVYDTDGDTNEGLPFLNVRLEDLADETRSGTYYFDKVFDFTLANPAPLDSAGVTSIGAALTGAPAIETNCYFQQEDEGRSECFDSFSGERAAAGTLTGYPYVPTVTYVNDNRSAFWLGGSSEPGSSFNNSYAPEEPFDDFSWRFGSSYLRSGTLYTSVGAGAVSQGGSNGRNGGIFDVTFYLTAPTEINLSGRVSGSSDYYGGGSGEVILYSGAEINAANQVFRAYEEFYDGEFGGNSQDYDFVQVLPAGQYRLIGEATASYIIGFGNASIEATFTKVGPSGKNKADTDGDWVRDELEIMKYGTNPNKADTDGDGYNDFVELSKGFDPLDPNDTNIDTDGDWIRDAVEVIVYGTNPDKADTDGDGFSDSAELFNGFDPLDSTDARIDSDGDWVYDLAEIVTHGTDPNSSDSDGDGSSDFEELLRGTDPTDPSSTPPGETLVSGLRTMQSSGGTRSFYLQLPDDYDPEGDNRPLIVGFHGSFGSHQAWVGSSPNYDFVETVGNDAIMVFPDALPLADGQVNWNIDTDVPFFPELIAELDAIGLQYNPNKLFVTGHSSGAGMTHEVACQHGDIVRGAAPSAGSLITSQCTGSVAVIQSQGESDALVPIGIASAARRYWSLYNGFELGSFTPGVVDECVDHSLAPLGSANYPVQWCQHPGGHAWSDYASEAFWTFFQGLPEVTPTSDHPPGGGNDRVAEAADTTMSFTLRFPDDIGTVTGGAITLYEDGYTGGEFRAPSVFLNADWPPGDIVPGSTVTYNDVPISFFVFSGSIDFPSSWALQVSVYVEGGSRPIPTPGIDHQVILPSLEFTGQFAPVLVPGTLELAVVEPF